MEDWARTKMDLDSSCSDTDYEKVLVECVCWPPDGESVDRSEGWISLSQSGKEEQYAVFLPLPRPSFDWLWATLARCQDCLSEIEVDISYAPKKREEDPRRQDMLISGASFTLCTGEYFRDM